MVVDLGVGVGLDERESTETWVGWVGDTGDTVELELPDDGAAVVDDVNGDDVLCAWFAEGVVDVDGSVGFDDRAELDGELVLIVD